MAERSRSREAASATPAGAAARIAPRARLLDHLPDGLHRLWRVIVKEVLQLRGDRKMIPAMGIGLLIGERIHTGLSPRAFQRFVCAALAACGAALLLQRA